MRDAPAVARLMNAEASARLTAHLLGQNLSARVLFDLVVLHCPLARHINQHSERKFEFLFGMILFYGVGWRSKNKLRQPLSLKKSEKRARKPHKTSAYSIRVRNIGKVGMNFNIASAGTVSIQHAKYGADAPSS
jgi:hypothetical protein